MAYEIFKDLRVKFESLKLNSLSLEHKKGNHNIKMNKCLVKCLHNIMSLHY